jgi:hypothetical protein
MFATRRETVNETQRSEEEERSRETPEISEKFFIKFLRQC